MTATIVPPQPDPERSVYVGGTWDPVDNVVTGGHWERPTHGGLCASVGTKRRAVVGPHWHWNGEYEMACPLGEHCPGPSCHEAAPGDVAYTPRREPVELPRWRPELVEKLAARARAFAEGKRFVLAFVAEPKSHDCRFCGEVLDTHIVGYADDAFVCADHLRLLAPALASAAGVADLLAQTLEALHKRDPDQATAAAAAVSDLLALWT